MKRAHIFLLSASFLPFQAHAMDSYTVEERIYNPRITYSPKNISPDKDESYLSTPAQRPKKDTLQKVLIYDKTPQEMSQERVLKKIVPAKDGRTRIEATTKWPYSIHAHLDVVFDGELYGGSGVMVGPHHLLTCGHNVYDNRKNKWAEKILVYPALNEKSAPFGSIKVVKAYTPERWKRGDAQFDIALLVLDQPVGESTGWGSLLWLKDEELSQEKVNITGYPGDKGSRQMWSMCHTIKTVSPEQFEYEIDTCAGQSGSAIWINKRGTPEILGVHTLGSNSVNSGVRISINKFQNFLLKIISDTYVINGEVPNNNNKAYSTPINSSIPYTQPQQTGDRINYPNSNTTPHKRKGDQPDQTDQRPLKKVKIGSDIIADDIGNMAKGYVDYLPGGSHVTAVTGTIGKSVFGTKTLTGGIIKTAFSLFSWEDPEDDE